MPLTLSRSTPTCVVSLPTLVIAGRPDLGRRVVDLLGQLAIVDVDIAPDYVEGLVRASERDYSVIVLAGRPARIFGFQRFCASFGGTAGGPPAVIQIQDRAGAQGPCSGLPAIQMEPDFDRDDLQKAVWAAVERSGQRCKSAGLCGRLSCSLDPRKRLSH